MKSVIPSLFNFLDKKAKGYVTFEELALRIYPTLTRKNLSTINKWVKGYSKILQRDQKSLLLKEEKEDEGINKKKILPKSTLKRFYEIFELFDEERKGCNILIKIYFIYLLDLTLQNLKSSFTFGFSPKEIEDLFNEHDKDKDGFLQIEDFIRILLPSDYIIDDHDEQN